MNLDLKSIKILFFLVVLSLCTFLMSFAGGQYAFLKFALIVPATLMIVMFFYWLYQRAKG
jgi:hypothetical protein